MRYTVNQEQRVVFIVAVFLLGLLVFPIDSNANEKDKELELTWLLLSKGREFFNKGNYSAAVDMLKDFIDKGKNKKKQLKNEYAQAYYILARVYFDAEELENLEKNLKNLFHTDLNYNIPGSDEAKFKEKAELIRQEIVKTRKITANFSLGDIDGPVHVVFFELDQKNMKKFSHPQKITLELPKPGTYAFYFFKDDRYVHFDGKISQHLEKTIDFKKAHKIPIIEKKKEKIEDQTQTEKKVFRFVEKKFIVPAHNQKIFETRVDTGLAGNVRSELILEMEPFHKDKVRIILRKSRSKKIEPGEKCKIENGQIVLRLSPTELPKKIPGKWELKIVNKHAAKAISIKKAELHFYPAKKPTPANNQQEK
jgi:tetratricopeptide (TPR) repeat protein